MHRILLLAALLTGCVRPAAAPPPVVEAPALPPASVPTREPWIDPPGPLVEAGSGLTLPLRPGWQVRPGRGAYPWEARHEATGARLWFGTWTGNEAELQDRYDERPMGFVARGTQRWLELLGDAPPWVGSREAPGGVRVGWYLAVGGRPVAIEALLPSAGTEAAWREVTACFEGMRRGVPGT